MNWKNLPNWIKGLIVGLCISGISYFLFPILFFLGFFGSWLNFEQYSLTGFAANVQENYFLSFIIILTISILVGLRFDLKQKKKKKSKVSVNFMIIVTIILIAELFAFGYFWKNSGFYQTWDTLDDCAKLKMAEKMDSCYFNFAVKNNDPSLCYKVGQSHVRVNECLANVNKDASYCDDYPDQGDRDYCFEIISVDLLDRSLCNRVSNPERRVYCLGAFNTYISVNNIEI